ncbi:hypothetical protein Tco_1447614 [Tanacetum coccineum]
MTDPLRENIDYVDASPPDDDTFSLEVVKIVIRKFEGWDDDILLQSKTISFLKNCDMSIFLIAKIEFIKNNPTHHPNSDQISSGSPTTHSELSLPDYKAFYVDNDHFKEKNSDSTTTHAEFSQYDSFIFDFSINPFPLADRSDFYHEEFADGLAPIKLD